MNSVCHWRGQIAGTLSKERCHFFPKIITRKLRKLLKKTSRSPAAQHSKLIQARVTYTKAFAMDAFTVEGCLLT